MTNQSQIKEPDDLRFIANHPFFLCSAWWCAEKRSERGGLVVGLVFGGYGQITGIDVLPVIDRHLRADLQKRRFARKAALTQCFARMAWKMLKNKKHAHYRTCFWRQKEIVALTCQSSGATKCNNSRSSLWNDLHRSWRITGKAFLNFRCNIKTLFWQQVADEWFWSFCCLCLRYCCECHKNRADLKLMSRVDF